MGMEMHVLKHRLVSSDVSGLLRHGPVDEWGPMTLFAVVLTVSVTRSTGLPAFGL